MVKKNSSVDTEEDMDTVKTEMSLETDSSEFSSSIGLVDDEQCITCNDCGFIVQFSDYE
jgi:hypothetical protein